MDSHCDLLNLIRINSINATYCLVWDVTMDWGMMKNPAALVEQTVGQCIPLIQSTPNDKRLSPQSSGCIEATLRPRLRFGASLSLLVVVIDTVLRFSWTLRFFEGQLFTSSDAYILCTEFMEVFRRALWNLLRVEWEYIKQMRAKKAQVADEGNLEMTNKGAKKFSKPMGVLS
jgi:hypothetical protein